MEEVEGIDERVCNEGRGHPCSGTNFRTVEKDMGRLSLELLEWRSAL